MNIRPQGPRTPYHSENSHAFEPAGSSWLPSSDIAKSKASVHSRARLARRVRRARIAFCAEVSSPRPVSRSASSGVNTPSTSRSGKPSQYCARRVAAALRSPHTPSVAPGS